MGFALVTEKGSRLAGGPFRLYGANDLTQGLEALRLQAPPDQLRQGDPLICGQLLQLLTLAGCNPEVQQGAAGAGLFCGRCRHRW